MNRFKISYLLLLLMSVLTVCMGLSFGITGLMDGAKSMASTLLYFWPNIEEISSSALNYSNWSLGMLGASVTGLGVLLFYIVKYPFKQKERGAWIILLVYLVLWFLLELLITVKYSITPLLFQNIFYFLGFLIPLLLTRSAFFNKKETRNEE